MSRTKSQQSLRRTEFQRPLPGGIVLKAKVSPCVFIYQGYPLQIQVSVFAQKGDREFGVAYAGNANKNAETATASDVVELLSAVQMIPCSACASPAFDPSTVETNRGGLCEDCFWKDAHAELERDFQAETDRLAAADTRMKALGMRFRVTAWIHPQDGDDYEIDWYAPDRPTPTAIRRHLRKRGAEMDDWRVVEL